MNRHGRDEPGIRMRIEDLEKFDEDFRMDNVVVVQEKQIFSFGVARSVVA